MNEWLLSKNHLIWESWIKSSYSNIKKYPIYFASLLAQVLALAEALWDKSCAFISTINGLFYFQFEFECRARGADILAYPPVVAGGNRSNTLHYVKNNQLIKVNELCNIIVLLSTEPLQKK